MIINCIKNDIERVWNTDYKKEFAIISKDEQEAVKNRLALRIMLVIEALVRDGYDLSEAYERASLLLITSPGSVECNLQFDWESLRRSISESGVF